MGYARVTGLCLLGFGLSMAVAAYAAVLASSIVIDSVIGSRRTVVHPCPSMRPDASTSGPSWE